MIKQIFVALLFGYFMNSYASTITQKQLKEQLIPILKNSIIFEKFKPVLARKGEIGEIIKTFTKDGLETINRVTEPSYIVKNTTDAQEEYIVTKEKFEKKYTFIKTYHSNWCFFKPVGKIKAIKVKNKETFFIISPWGEKMIVKKDDFLVSPLDYSEVYRVANKEFFETYRAKDLPLKLETFNIDINQM